MAPFGKAHAAVHSAGDRIKSGLAWAHHKYQQGVGLAQKTNLLYETGKKIAGILLPHADRLHPAITPGVMGGVQALDQLRDAGISKHTHILDQIRANSGVLDDLRKAQAMAQPFMS